MKKNTIQEIAVNNNTPFYLYDVGLLRETIETAISEAQKYGYELHYALKANFSEQILKIISSYGIGADCVSGNEIDWAVRTGFKPEKIVFAGVGKTDDEINLALNHNIFCLNCESLQEISVINQLAGLKNQKADIALRINPDIDAHTHKFITTGLNENKFGISCSDLDKVLNEISEFKNIRLKGLHFHIGSQILNLKPFKELCLKINQTLNLAGELEFVNVGGGLGIDYVEPEQNRIPDFKNYFKVFNDNLQLNSGQKIHFELGRSIVGQCGSLISRVLYVKPGNSRNYLILDAGMTHLIRPALYQAQHKIENLSSVLAEGNKYDIVGPICESSDVFAQELSFPKTERGDIIQIKSAGAYGEVMSSQYNMKTLFPAVFVNQSVFAENKADI